MNRLPLIPTILVALAVATMIALGFWQIERKGEKEALLARLEAATDQPAVAYPTVPLPDALPLYRRSSVRCLVVTGWRSIAGQSADGQSGYAHIARCRTGGGEGPGAAVAVGWTDRPEAPTWNGGVVEGVIAPDNEALIRLVSADAAPCTQRLAAPSPDSIPNNHLMYAIQWFLFAGIALLIYGLALRKRRAEKKD